MEHADLLSTVTEPDPWKAISSGAISSSIIIRDIRPVNPRPTLESHRQVKNVKRYNSIDVR